MKSISAVLLATVLALGCVAVSLFGLNDHAVLTPPPEAVAEEFTRQIAAGRAELVRPLLSRAARERETTQVLRARTEPLRRAVGVLEQVSAVAGWVRDHQAAAHALLQGDTGTAVLSFTFVREQGRWTVDEWHRSPAGE